MIEFDFAEWLKETLERKHISGYALARRTGMGQYTIYSYLKDKRNPSLLTFLYILDALGLEMKIVDKKKHH